MANRVTKADHYYGAFLTKVLDNSNEPALISKDDGRGIYRLKCAEEEYTVYIKYASNRDKSKIRWAFNYTDNNMEEIKKYVEDGENLIFAYVCSYDGLLDSEIGIAKVDELMECIDPECEINQSKRITIYKKPNSPVLRMYGTRKADIKDGKDNTVHLSRSRINEL